MDDPSAESLSPRPLPELADDLRAHRAEIIDAWQKLSAQALPRANALTLAQFRDDLPSLLESLAAALSSGQIAGAPERHDSSPDTGGARFHPQFVLDDLLAAYQLLRIALFQHLERALERGLMSGEILGLNSAIDSIVRSAAVAHAGQQARQLADQAKRTCDDLSRLSHDVRGDLNSAVLLSDVLRRKLGAEARFADSVADLATLRKSMLDAAQRIQRLLDQQRGDKSS